jgi:RNA polymerase sigma factor (sigma-70 family)
VHREGTKPQIDDLLLPFLNAPGEAESNAILEQLICHHAQPLIQNIIHYKLSVAPSPAPFNQDAQEVEDVANEVILRLVRALQECRSSPQEKSIASLRSYVAMMAYNASDEYLRQKYPRRASLKNKIRYLLTHQPGLGLWESPTGKLLCGLPSWQQAKHAAAQIRQLSQIQDELDVFLQKRFRGTETARVKLPELLAALFEFSDSPIEIETLVTWVSEILGIREARFEAITDDTESGNLSSLSTDPRARAEETFDHKARLETVWQEILQLPPRQRTALLLNLRDEEGGSAIVLLPILRIATIQQIAEALELSAEELASMWNDLPLEDGRIAERLCATRQQVINLRKCARARLARRLQASGK